MHLNMGATSQKLWENLWREHCFSFMRMGSILGAVYLRIRSLFKVLYNEALNQWGSQPVGWIPLRVIYQICCISGMYIVTHNSSKVTVWWLGLSPQHEELYSMVTALEKLRNTVLNRRCLYFPSFWFITKYSISSS